MGCMPMFVVIIQSRPDPFLQVAVLIDLIVRQSFNDFLPVRDF
jgi:hypothetical protein